MQHRFFILGCFIFFIASGAMGCGENSIRNTKELNQIVISDSSLHNISSDYKLHIVKSHHHFDSSLLESFFIKYPLFHAWRNVIQRFYSRRNYEFIWFDDCCLLPKSDTLIDKLMNIRRQGLPDRVVYKSALLNLKNASGENKTPHTEMEIMLTAQYLTYVKFTATGMGYNNLNSTDWEIPIKKIDFTDLLDSMCRYEHLYLHILMNRQYVLLQEYLQRYCDIKEMGGWPSIQMAERKLKPGDSSDIISQVRSHLYIVGDISHDNHSKKYDSLLFAAVIMYQFRLGLDPNGIITNSVINEMNQPVEKRIDQIIVNLERARWMHLYKHRNHIDINIPEFYMHVYENNVPVIHMKVIIGKPKNKTKVFSGEITHVIFCPYWNVPQSILKKEIMPILKRNPHYLISQNMEWHNGLLRQRPGSNNALGLFKFLFPNPYSIY
ncbi:MAG: hypothetical protein FGM46_10010, partial [Ferruginibacter sp.]|nr:hypothetical protein [Ferruginibacter sp.]